MQLEEQTTTEMWPRRKKFKNKFELRTFYFAETVVCMLQKYGNAKSIKR